MIDDLDRSIRQLLERELQAKSSSLGIEFHRPTREWSASLTRPTVNLFLYDVRENNTLRQHQWERVGNGRDNQSHQKRTPYRVDCHYMLTCWANEPEDEHLLLSRTMLTLLRHPILPEEVLVGQMRRQPFEIQAHLARHDRLTNPAEVWSVLDNEMRPAMAYIVTLAFDPWTEVTGPEVHTFTLRTGPAALPRERTLPADSTETLTTIGGRVYREREPQSGIRVALRGTGFVAITDAEGRFVLGMFPPGDYVLVASPKSGKPAQKAIAVPAENYDIELE